MWCLAKNSFDHTNLIFVCCVHYQAILQNIEYLNSAEPINFKRLKEFSIMERLQHFLRAKHKLILKIVWMIFYRSFMLNFWGYHVCFSYHLTTFESNISVYLLLNSRVFYCWILLCDSFVPYKCAENIHEMSVSTNTFWTRSHKLHFCRFSTVSLVKKFCCYHTQEQEHFQFHYSRLLVQAPARTVVTFWSLSFSGFEKFILLHGNEKLTLGSEKQPPQWVSPIRFNLIKCIRVL